MSWIRRLLGFFTGRREPAQAQPVTAPVPADPPPASRPTTVEPPRSPSQSAETPTDDAEHLDQRPEPKHTDFVTPDPGPPQPAPRPGPAGQELSADQDVEEPTPLEPPDVGYSAADADSDAPSGEAAATSDNTPAATPEEAALVAGPHFFGPSLPDFSDVTYVELADGFAPPPGAPSPARTDVAPSAKRGEATTRRSVLPPTMADEVLGDLAAAGPAIMAGLASEPVHMAVPTSAGPGRYRVEAPGKEFHEQDDQGTFVVRTLDRALASGGDHQESRPDPLDRLELVRLVAVAVDALHARGVITAGLHLDTFAYTLVPRPGVTLVRPDQLRVVGGEFLTGVAVRDDWDSADRDRFDFAVLAYRLLVAGRRDATIDVGHRPHVPGLDDRQVGEVWRLWQRTAGPAGTRPQISEWTRGLRP